MEEEEGDAAGERERCEVEGDHQQALTADDRERESRSHQLGDEELARRDEVEAEDEADLAQGQAARLAADVDVEGEGLGQEVHEREGPPGHARPLGGRVEARDD